MNMRVQLIVFEMVGFVILAALATGMYLMLTHTDPTKQAPDPLTASSCITPYYSPASGAPAPQFPNPAAVAVGQTANPTDLTVQVVSVSRQTAIGSYLPWNGTYLDVRLTVRYTGTLAAGVTTGPWDMQLITNRAQRVCADAATTVWLDKTAYPVMLGASSFTITVRPGASATFDAAFDVNSTDLSGAYLQYWSPAPGAGDPHSYAALSLGQA